MQPLLNYENFKPPSDNGKKFAVDSSYGNEFSQLMPPKPSHGSGKSAQRPAYEPGKYTTVPNRKMLFSDLLTAERETGRSKSDLCDKHASYSSKVKGKCHSLQTGNDGQPALLREYHQEESVWNPRASMAFDSAKGLLNPLGQNNCFLNSAVQVLWHLDVFRRNFRILSGHGCVQNSCIFCALKVLFTQFQFSDYKVLPSDVLREALAEAFANERRFQLGRMDDASECFETILQRIHFHLAWNESEETCRVQHCIPHQKFAMLLVEQMVCACNASGEPLIFNQLVYHVSTSAIISYMRLARLGAENERSESFGRLLYHARNSGESRRCLSSCGGLVETRHTLANTPEVVSIGFIWDSDHPSRSRVRKIIQCISTELSPSELVYSVVDEDWGQTTTLRLVGLVCYHGRHYSTFVFHSKMLTWILFDDARVREIGPAWETLMDLCVAGLYQPLLLLYADPNDRLIDVSSAPAKNVSIQREATCSALEQTERGEILEATLNQKQSSPSRCSSKRDLLFGGDCTTEKTGSKVCASLSSVYQHDAEIVKIREPPGGQLLSPETMSLARDISRMRSMDSTEKTRGDFLMFNRLSLQRSSSLPQGNMFGQQAIPTKEAAESSSVDTSDHEICLNSDKVVGSSSCTTFANGTNGCTVSRTEEPAVNRAKSVHFSHQGVGVSPGGTMKSFAIPDVEEYPRFPEQSATNRNHLHSANRVSNSLQSFEDRLKITNPDGVGHHSSGDGNSVSDCRSFRGKNNSRTIATVRESGRGPSQNTALSAEEGKGSGVYIDRKTVRNVLSSQGFSCRRSTSGEVAYSKSVLIGTRMAELIANDNHSRNGRSTGAETVLNTNRVRTLKKSLSEAWDTGRGCLDEQQPLLHNRTSNTVPAVYKPGVVSKFLARTADLQTSNAEISPTANSISVSETAPTTIEVPISSVPRSATTSCQPSNIDTCHGYNTFPRRSRNIESKASHTALFTTSQRQFENKNHSSTCNTSMQTTNEQKSTSDNNGNVCRWVEQGSDYFSSDGTLESSVPPPVGFQLADRKPSTDSGSDDLAPKNSFSPSHGSKMQLFRDSLQLLKSCDEHIALSKAELDMGNERLAAKHCSMASVLLDGAFQPCQLDIDLEFLFRCSQNNVEKCRRNLKRYVAHFSNTDRAPEEYKGQVGSKRDVEPVFYLSACIPSRQADTKERSVDECRISSSDISYRVSAAEDKEAIPRCQLRPTVNLTCDPTVSRRIVNASQIKGSPLPNVSGRSDTNSVDPGGVSTNGKLVNSLLNFGSSSSLTKDLARSSSLSTMSLPRNVASVSSSMSLPRNGTSVSSSTSLPRHGTSVSSSLSLHKTGSRVPSSARLPRHDTEVSASSMSLPRYRTYVSSVSLNGTSLSSFSKKGTVASLSTRSTTLPDFEMSLESDDRTKPFTGLSRPDSATVETSSLLSMSQKLQMLEKQNRAIRDKLLKEKDVLWS